MEIISELLKLGSSCDSVALAIGNFDGVHLGHLANLEALKSKAESSQSHSMLLSFSNHPASILRPDKLPTRICTQEHKIELLTEAGVETLLLLPFTQKFADQDPLTFLQEIARLVPLKHLVLGYDSAFGKNRKGDKEMINTLAHSLGIEVEFIDQQFYKGTPISSTIIREKILMGDFDGASKLLARPYSIMGPIIKGAGIGKKLGFPTLNLELKGLCTPPFGVYTVTCMIGSKEFPAIANLGLAPTLKAEPTPKLEVHLLDPVQILGESLVNVIFHEFIRPEKKFSSKEDLTEQIKKDILKAKALF
jgi:riboflavin kinase/FMN adenylyltransferase